MSAGAPPPQTFLEFFAGIGLMRMGLETQGWRCLFANDHCRRKKQIYDGFFPPLMEAGAGYAVKPVEALRAAALPSATLATASFPCTDISIAGAQGGIHTGQSKAFFSFLNLVVNMQPRLRPPLLLLENVPALITGNGGADFRALLRALNNAGYACDAVLVNAQSFLPQSRNRIFILAARASLPAVANHLPFCPRILRGRGALAAPPRLVEAMAAANAAGAYCFTLPGVPPPPPLRKSGLTAMLEELPPTSPHWWPANRVEAHIAKMPPAHLARLLQGVGAAGTRAFSQRSGKGLPARCNVREQDTISAITPSDRSKKNNIAQTQGYICHNRNLFIRHQDTSYAIRKSQGGGKLLAIEVEKTRAFYIRSRGAELRAQDTAGCLRNAEVGTGAKQKLATAAGGYYVRMRGLRPREAARLMGVPDSKPITANSDTHALSAFGDAVAVPAVEWVARNFLARLLRML